MSHPSTWSCRHIEAMVKDLAHLCRMCLASQNQSTLPSRKHQTGQRAEVGKGFVFHPR